MGMLSVTPPALAYLDAAISSRAADATVAKPESQLSGTIKSVQRGTADLASTTALDVTVSAVTVAKCELSHLGTKGADAAKNGATLQLTGATTLRIERYGVTAGPVVAWQIVERY